MLDALLERVESFQYFLVWDWLPIIKLMDSVIIALVWSLAVKCWDSRAASKRRVPWWAQHTSYLYFQFACILAAQLYTFKHEVHMHSDQTRNLQEFLRVALNGSDDTSSVGSPQLNAAGQECMEHLPGGSRGSEDFPRLVQFAFTTPLWVLGTFVLSGVMTFKHIVAVCAYKKDDHHPPHVNYTLWNRPGRHRTIWILQLPLVYSITVLFAVQKALHRSRLAAAALLVHEHCPQLCPEIGCWSGTGSMQTFYVESALSFGDAYEGFALLLFASSTVDVIKARVEGLVDTAKCARDRVVEDRQHHPSESKGEQPPGRQSVGGTWWPWARMEPQDGRVDALERQLQNERAENARLSTQLVRLSQANAGPAQQDSPGEVPRQSARVSLIRADEKLGATSEKLAMVTHNVATIGIKYFSFTCFVQAILPMVSCQAHTLARAAMGAGLRSVHDTALHVHEATRRLAVNSNASVKGMGFLGSCVAIHNMVLIEQSFHHDFLEGFQPTAKFVSVKIMVSIVFFQELFLPMLLGIDPEGAGGLLDATLRSVEFFAIAVFNIWAWKVDERWYHQHEMRRNWGEFKRDITLPFIGDSRETFLEEV